MTHKSISPLQNVMKFLTDYFYKTCGFFILPGLNLCDHRSRNNCTL